MMLHETVMVEAEQAMVEAEVGAEQVMVEAEVGAEVEIGEILYTIYVDSLEEKYKVCCSRHLLYRIYRGDISHSF